MTPEARARQEAGYQKHLAIMEDEELEVVDVDVWFQTSRRYRSVARLPEGKTGIEALIEAEFANLRETLPEGHEAWEYWNEHIPRWANGLGEASATDHFCACHAGRKGRVGLTKELNHKSFEAFKKAGGGSAAHRTYERGAPQRAEEERLARIALEERRANQPLQVPVGDKMRSYCRTCGHLADEYELGQRASYKKQCDPCRAMRKRGWIGDGSVAGTEFKKE